MKVISLQRIHMRQEAIMRKRRRANRKRKSIHLHRRRRKSTQSKKPQQRFATTAPVEVFAPSHFTIRNLDRVLSFLDETERQINNSDTKILKVNLDYVTEIDSYAISLLLSMLSRMSYKNVNYWGTYPNSQDAKDFIIESGFLDVMKSNVRRPSKKRLSNRILMIGKESVESHRIGKAVKESMAFITGQEDYYPPVYDDMLEISANSVEHANLKTKDKNWLVSITFEEDKVHYILTDTGLGILSTLKKKFSQKVKDATIKTDAQILRDVFRKEYQSASGEINRYKGLPIIYESFTEGYVSDLIVVTNKVYYDFENKNSKELKRGYKGVLYSWTVSKANYDKWYKSLEQ